MIEWTLWRSRFSTCIHIRDLGIAVLNWLGGDVLFYRRSLKYTVGERHCVSTDKCIRKKQMRILGRCDTRFMRGGNFDMNVLRSIIKKHHHVQHE